MRATQVAVIKGFIVHNLTDLWKESKWGFVYRLYPGLSFFIHQFMMLQLLALFKVIQAYKLPGGISANSCCPSSCIDMATSGSFVDSNGDTSTKWDAMKNWTTTDQSDYCAIVVTDEQTLMLYVYALM